MGRWHRQRPVLNSKEDYITKGVMWERVGKWRWCSCAHPTLMTKDSKGKKQRRKRSYSMNICWWLVRLGVWGDQKWKVYRN